MWQKLKQLPIQAETALLLSMIPLQLLWLALTGWLEVTATAWKVPWLLAASLLVSLLALRLPREFFTERLSRLPEWFKRHSFLAMGCWGLILALVYSIFQHAWADEVPIRFAAEAFASGGWDELVKVLRTYNYFRQHPPLLYIWMGLVLRISGGSFFAMRALVSLFAMGTVLLTCKLGQELYNRQVGLFAGFLLLCFPLFIRLAGTCMADVPVTFFFALALYYFIRLSKSPTLMNGLILVLTLIVGILIKYTFLFIFPLLLVLCLLPEFASLRKPFLWILGGVAIVAIVYALIAYQAGYLSRQLRTLLSYSTAVFRSLRGKQLLMETLVTRLPASIGVYLAPALFWGLGTLRHWQSSSVKILLAWIGVVSLLLMVTLPDHRYFMPVFPGIAILAAQGLSRLKQSPGRILFLSLAYQFTALYLFLGWDRLDHWFLPDK